jgi:hypothetical protein
MGFYIMIKESNEQEVITIINMYTSMPDYQNV